MKKILLTGGTGLLGSYILRKLLASGYEVVILKRSFSNTSRIQSDLSKITSYNIDKIKLSEVFQRESIETVLHCATDYGRKKVDPVQLIQANLILPLELLHLSLLNGVKTFINTDTILDKRMNEYSLSKKQFSEWLKFYSTKLVCINVAIEHFYGPGDDNSKFLSFIIQELLSNKERIPLTKGEQARDFIYIDDVVSAFMAIIAFTNVQKTGLYNFEIGTGKTIKIKDLVEKIKVMIGNQKTQLDFGALPYRPYEVMESCVDLAAITKLGWRPVVLLDEGLKRTIESEKQR